MLTRARFVARLADLALTRYLFCLLAGEFHDAYYRVGSYVTAKIAADVPAAALSALSYTAILYPSVGLTPGAGPFLFFALTTFVNLMIATLVGCACVPLTSSIAC